MTGKGKELHRILEVRELTDSTFVIRMERKEMAFIPGQYVNVGTTSSLHEREYSIYSGLDDPWLEILVRKVLDGDVSILLKSVLPGDQLRISGPFGAMTLEENKVKGKKFFLISTGTGIAPFRSFVRSFRKLDYRIIHGVKYSKEAYDIREYDSSRFVLCTSVDRDGDYHGRVTAFLRESEIDTEGVYYACGNSNMVYEVYNILREKGVSHSNMFSEIYF